MEKSKNSNVNEDKNHKNSSIIVFDQVIKRYPNGVYALRGASFRVERGEFVFLTGSSGAGKTTLTKLLMKEETVTKGRIFVNGVNLKKLFGYKVSKYRRDLGIVFQDFRLLNKKTVFDNIAFAMEITGESRKAIEKRVDLALSIVGLTHKSKEYPEHLSGGEQQRVALARAIVNSPKMIIADEPTGNLDPRNSREIMRLLEEINKRGITVIVVTHEKNLVETMKKRVIRLDYGKIVNDEEASIQNTNEEVESDEQNKNLFIYD